MDTETRKLALQQGLCEAEYDRVVELLGRPPTEAEVAVFSAMWSEHVSYKSSRLHLRTLPTRGERLVVGPGENAGVVDIGDGLGLAFKVESHNHPSYIEPFQGAATGVGGIIRDIFSMGAWPIACLDSLRFGSPEHPRTRFLVAGVVGGIGHYGNCVGVPTVGGELEFHPTYNHNCIVNVFTIGVLPLRRLHLASASGPGNLVVYAGGPTGRDGIHGATMASAPFERDAEERRPAVQVGDPFMERRLLEGCIELMERGLLAGIQDMGAAGLTCATFEMASKGKAGMRVDLSSVPVRQDGLSASEILLSESQERMLMVVRPQDMKEAAAILDRWDIPWSVIGEVVEPDRVTMRHRGKVVVDLPTSAVVDQAPVFDRAAEPPGDLEKRWQAPSVNPGIDLDTLFWRLWSHSSLRSARAAYETYDHMVQIRTVVGPGEGDAAVLRLLESPPRAVAIALDGNPSACWLDPYRGTYDLVAEGLLNLACVGAEPVGLTNCLNFGNPERPQVMWEFREAVRGLGQACLDFGVPVTGGNVSFYNETNEVSIFPTPVVGLVGLIDDVARTCRMAFRMPGDRVLVVGWPAQDLGASMVAELMHGKPQGRPRMPRPERHRALCSALVSAIRKGLLRSAHDISRGGLACALAECCVAGSVGARVELLPGTGIPPHVALFGESPSCVVVSVRPEETRGFADVCRYYGVPVCEVGEVGGHSLEVEHFLRLELEQMVEVHERPPPGL